MIIFDQVTKKFGSGAVALDNVTFHIEPKEFVFITGHSGAGKTTLLRLMLREFLPTSGTIFVNKTDVISLPPDQIPQLRRQIGAAFQDFKLLHDWTAAENIGLSLEILGQDEVQIAERVGHLLELVSMKDKGDLFPSQLSGGELQRLVIARALAPEPKVLFADEPTGNLDQKTALQIIDLLKDINRLGTTVIMATHNQEIAAQSKSRVIDLEKGKITKDIEGKSKSQPKPSKKKPKDKNPKPKV